MKLLLETLQEEKATDEKLTILAKQELSDEMVGSEVAQHGKTEV